MGKGDKKSRRGKIIIGSTGVRRPKSSKNKAIVKVEVVEKTKKVADAPKAEPKPKAKVAELVANPKSEITVAPEKTVKKTVKKTKDEDVSE